MKPSGIITLLTDFGLADSYVAMMKGVILSINPEAVLVDISHSIPTGLIARGAEMLRESYPFFPEGTVHLAVVDPGVGTGRRLLCIEAEGQFFAGPDNGIFWPVIKDCKDAVIVSLTESRYFLPRITNTFHGRDVFAPVAAHLSLGEDIFLMGERAYDPCRINLPTQYITDNILYGEVTHVDNFGNLITNIHKQTLEDFLKEANPVISVGDLELRNISSTYLDVEKGEPVAIINSSDMLEMAVNLGRASAYSGISGEQLVGSTVKIKRGS